MNKLISLVIFLIISCIVYSQVPQAFNYQAIVRDNNGDILVNKAIQLKVSILKDSEDDASVYSEHHKTTTNSFGLINLQIGTGNTEDCGLKTADFSKTDWSSGPHYLKIEIDKEGNGLYEPMGISQLLSVPYALYAGNSGSNSLRSGEWTNNGTHIMNNESSFPMSNVGIGSTLPGGKLHIYGQGFFDPNAPMLFVQHQNGFSSTFRRNTNSQANSLFLLQKSRGTKETPLAVQDGDYIGQIRMEGYDGTNYKTAGWVRTIVDGSVSSGKVPGALLFATTSSAGIVAERMRITSEGKIGIGVTNPWYDFEIRNSSSVQARLKSDFSSYFILDKGYETEDNYLLFRTNNSDNFALGTWGDDDFMIKNIGLYGIYDNTFTIDSESSSIVLNSNTFSPNDQIGMYPSNLYKGVFLLIITGEHQMP